MASNYQKMTMKIFSERLSSNHYANATGARRAVGKSDMTDDEKRKAYSSIDRHFGVEPMASGTKPAAKKTVAKKTVAKTARGAGRAPRSTAKKGSRASTETDSAPGVVHQEIASLHAGASATREAMAGLSAASEFDSTIDLKMAARRGADILQYSIDRIGELLGRKDPSLTPSPGTPSEEEESDEDQS